MNAETIARLLEYMDLKQFFADNSPLRLAILLGIVIFLLFCARILCAFAQKKIERALRKPHGAKGADAPAADVVAGMDIGLFERVMRNIRLILNLIIVGWGFKQLIFGPLYAEAVHIIFVALGIWAAIRFFSAFVPFNIDIYLRRHGTTLGTSQTRSLMPIIKGFIWAIGLTFLLDNLGFHVSTIIAGLGIVGVAVGLAGQAILADFFSYIVILLDKPFRIGDYVEIGEGKAGEVIYMGPKTTHLRSLNDDLIVCANSQMTRGVLVNQGSIHERDVIEDFGVAYDTPLELLRKLPGIVGDVVNAFPQCSFDRACLLKFGASNLNFQLIYQVAQQRGGLRDFMNTRSEVNMAILAKFAELKINMAYPTEHVLLTELPNEATAPVADKDKTSHAGA